jgi:hypothetical protein
MMLALADGAPGRRLFGLTERRLMFGGLCLAGRGGRSLARCVGLWSGMGMGLDMGMEVGAVRLTSRRFRSCRNGLTRSKALWRPMRVSPRLLLGRIRLRLSTLWMARLVCEWVSGS